MMKRLLLVAVASLATFGCAAIEDFRKDENPYENPFYAKYLNTGSTVDAQIQRTLEALRRSPDSPELHNTLGTLLLEKGFPKDAERELERAVNLNRRYYPAWYNLGLVRASRGDEVGAHRALARTVKLKPGHAAALFQLGLVEEKRHHTDRAVHLYAKAYAINPSLLDIDVNPRILDSKLTHLALLELYPTAHARQSMQFQGSAPIREPQSQPQAQPTAPSPEAKPQQIVPPTAPPTDPSQQRTPRRPPGN